MKKIAILGLHLNYGGVEQAIINQANFLCDTYEVELAVTYKINEEPAFFVNPKVKITYLTNCLPNREEFKKYIKERKFLKAFKEGLKSIKVLYKKYYSMKKYIKNCDADIIISSRVDIAKILNKFSPDKCITITEEHCHHNNNKKYINKLKKNCKNIDYLVSVSKELNDFYAKKINYIQCVYIPNALNFWPTNSSKLNNKNLISVGRLSKEKGFSDLIDVFKMIYDKDKNYHLDIIGDGIEYNNLLNKIKEYNLESAIKLHGFQNREYINKYLSNSSLYLMTSYEESFGIVLIEAGSFGVPQIAFDSAQGAKEIISNNKSGYLIKNRDKKEMALKTMNLINDKRKLKSFGDDAKTIAQTFSFENTKEKWLNFIGNLKKKKKKNNIWTKFLSNKYFSLLFILFSYLLIDIPLRYFSIKSIYFYSIRNIAPLLFSFSVIIFNLLIIRSLSKKSSIIYYSISIMFNYILALIQFFHYKILGNFFTFSELFLSKEGLEYISSIFEYINLKFVILNCLFILVFIISIISLSKVKKEKIKFKKKLIICLISILLQIIGIISLYFFNNNYDKNDNMSPIYNYFNIEVPYRSIQVLGTIQYNVYDIIYYYVNNIITKINVKKNYKIIHEYFGKMPDYEEKNEYTNIFKDKNLIYILLESGDDWLINEQYMPTLYNMSKDGGNFTNRYAPFFYGGYTFNSEFAANTGIYLTDNFEDSIDNYFPYSLPNLFKQAGYIVNAFHMNNAQFYERGIYHKTFGYSNYYGDYNTEKYLKNEFNYVNDVNWILNKETYDLLVPKNQKFMSFLITYSMHLPYFNNELCDEAIRNDELHFDKWEEREEVCLHYLSTKSDLMLKELLEHLEDDNLLDDIVIIIFADHDTYGFSDKEFLAKVKGTDNLYLQQKVPLIIWSKNIKHQDIDILMDTADLVPMIANLFGLEYENKNYLSTDVFSNYHDNYIYFQYGYVLNSDNKFSNNDAIGNKMINYNKYILSTDYYRRLEENE